MDHTRAQRLTVRGTVQGVGFRPFIHRLAHEHAVRGWVRNDTAGVTIHAEGAAGSLAAFAAAIREKRPPAAVIATLTAEPATPEGHTAFTIRESEGAGPPTTRISPDLAVCGDCLDELRDPADRRHGYPYINCTNCGPRYSIIRSLPYDRPRTTMADWALCPECRAEYDNPADRRYHAQPVACPRCGPAYRLVIDGDDETAGPDAIARAASMLADGAVLAIKGIGGYHLACDAGNDAAVRALRERKFRKEKPFALMAASLDTAARLAELDGVHAELLTGPAAPIVLARARAPMPLVAPDTDELGLMLPYAPLHRLLFDAGAPDPLVLTSANRSSEPIAYEDADALDRLAGLADAFLVGERPIQRRVDDSVVAARRGAPFMVRRARGYAPASVAGLETDRPILAVGADLKNAVALATGGEVFVSQHIGDLGDLETDRAFHETIDDLLSMYAVDRRELIVAHDLHPEYVSTRTALDLECRGRVAVQHHEAHIASVLLEHGLLDEPVVGVALDGTGFGRDGSVWGGELLVGSPATGFERAPLLTPVRMPGGDAAARHPVQAAAAYLPDADPAMLEADLFGFPPRFRRAQAMIAGGVRTTTTTSAGRLFDAAAAVCGFVRGISFEGQAAVWLEHLARGGDTDAGPVSPASADPRALIRGMVDARLAGAGPADLAAWFHRAVAGVVLAAATEAASRHGCATVALSGGVWQNRLLLDAVADAAPPGCRLLWNRDLPVNDGGVCAGQIAMAHRAAV